VDTGGQHQNLKLSFNEARTRTALTLTLSFNKLYESGAILNFHFASFRRNASTAVAAAMVASAFAATPAVAGVVGLRAGATQQAQKKVTVLPPQAQLNGFSLTEANKATAVFNTTVDPATGAHIGQPPAPFDASTHKKLLMLATTATNTFTVKSGTNFFIPALALTPAGIPTFPDVKDRKQVLDFLYSSAQLGLQTVNITVTGPDNCAHSFSLDEGYVTASYTPVLGDGTTSYIAVSGFLKSLPVGLNEVKISVSLDGALFGPVAFDIIYNVNVVK
jgi:hypothetical protein